MRESQWRSIGRVLRGRQFRVYEGVMTMDTPLADVASWQFIHEEILALALARAANEHALCGALLRAHRDGGWRKLGFASFLEYAEQFAGTTPRQTMDRLRVAVTLEQLPGLDAALATGRLPFTAVRELTRVITPDTEALWLARTQGLTVGEIQRLVSGREPGDLPDDPPRARRHRISLEVSADVYALFREAQAKVRADCGGALDDQDVLRVMARSVLDGSADEGRSEYQIAMTVCRACGTTTQDGAGQEIVVDETVAETALCDAQHIDEEGHAHQKIPPATRRLVLRRQHGKCAVPACRFTRHLHVHHLQLRSEEGTHHESNLAGLCFPHH